MLKKILPTFLAAFSLQAMAGGEEIPYPHAASPNVTEADYPEVLKVFALGDSLSQNFHVSNPVSMFLQIQNAADPDNMRYGFIDTSRRTDSIDSYFEQMSRRENILAINFAVAGANVYQDPNRGKYDGLSGIRGLGQQIDSLVDLRVRGEILTPDLVFFFIGHNDVNLISHGFAPDRLRDLFAAEYRRQLNRITQHLLRQSGIDGRHRAAVVYTMANFDSAFRAHNECRARKAADPKLFPHLEQSEDFFNILRPERQPAGLEMAQILGEEIETMVVDTNRELAPQSTLVNVFLAPGFTQQDDLTCDDLHEKDAFHASAQGHQKAANILLNGSASALDFVHQR